MREMREIGGYIEFEKQNGIEYHSKAIALNSARNCFAYLINSRNIRKVYLPYFLCDSVKEVCDKAGIEIEYYHINKEFRPIFHNSLEQDEWLYLVNYYGQFSNEQLRGYVTQFKNVIIDNVQSFFQMPIEGVDTIYTCRKFFGVPDGAYLYTDAVVEEKLSFDLTYNRLKHLVGRFEKTGNDFYREYIQAEEDFVGRPILKMSKFTRNLLCGIEYERIKSVREKNFLFLYDNLNKLNKLTVNFSEGPFMYPLYIEKGSEIRKRLQENKIYISILWPDVLKKCGRNELEHHLAENILPLPVDQRYGQEDMQYMINKLNDIMEEVKSNEY